MLASVLQLVSLSVISILWKIKVCPFPLNSEREDIPLIYSLFLIINVLLQGGECLAWYPVSYESTERWV